MLQTIEMTARQHLLRQTEDLVSWELTSRNVDLFREPACFLPHLQLLIVTLVHGAEKAGRTGRPSSAGRYSTRPFALRPLPSALCLLPSTFCPLPSALCPLPSTFCPPPSAFCFIRARGSNPSEEF